MKRRMFAIGIAWTVFCGCLSADAVYATESEASALFARENAFVSAEDSVASYHYLSDRFPGDARVTLPELDYTFLEEVEIPGMPETAAEDLAAGRIPAFSIYPQGICIAGDYLLITAYSEEKDVPGCLFLFDLATGEYLSTLGLKKSSHLGGITFDGENVWICHSDNDTLQRLPYVYINAVGRCASKELIDISDAGEVYPVENSPSCATFYNGRLFVATTTLLWNSELRSYSFENGTLIPENSYTIPSMVQGIAFDEAGRVFLSVSYGRRNSSYLREYANLTDMSNAPRKPLYTVELPPCSEELIYADGSLLVLFESAGYKYFYGTDGLGQSEAPVDKVLSVVVSSIEESRNSD